MTYALHVPNQFPEKVVSGARVLQIFFTMSSTFTTMFVSNLSSYSPANSLHSSSDKLLALQMPKCWLKRFTGQVQRKQILVSKRCLLALERCILYP
jgi:hypothetical protein